MMGYGRGIGLGYDMMGGGWLGGLVMLFFGLLVLAGLVLLVVWAVRATAGGHAPGSGASGGPDAGRDEAVAIARKRLASGEITAEQFDDIMRALGS